MVCLTLFLLPENMPCNVCWASCFAGAITFPDGVLRFFCGDGWADGNSSSLGLVSPSSSELLFSSLLATSMAGVGGGCDLGNLPDVVGRLTVDL